MEARCASIHNWRNLQSQGPDNQQGEFVRQFQRSLVTMEAAAGGGSQSARASRVAPGGRVRPEDVLDEMEYEKEEKAIRREMDELRKRRAEALRRRAAVQLEEHTEAPVLGS